jgi:hypothetical protein
LVIPLPPEKEMFRIMEKIEEIDFLLEKIKNSHSKTKSLSNLLYISILNSAFSNRLKTKNEVES